MNCAPDHSRTSTDYGAGVRVNLGPRSYDVRVGPGVLDRLGEWVRSVAPAGSAAVLSDATAGKLFAPAVVRSMEAAGYKTTAVQFPAGEESKSLEQAGRLYDTLFKHPFDRGSPFVAVGGGVAGDLVGFVAGTFKRGVPFIQVPTTLLAQVDASVGGKTGVNHKAGKNLIGVVHQPSLVAADVLCLKTLPADQFAAGMAEIVKHALIRDAALFDWLERHAERVVDRNSPGWAELMTDLVAWNCAIKARVVEADETESALRGILNYGHTVGHALEAVLGYGAILHGQAVAIGMTAAAKLAAARKLIDAGLVERQRQLLARFQLPTDMPIVNADAALEAVRQDKKVKAGKVRFVLLAGLGKTAFFDDVTEAEIRTVLRPGP
jgi:3-dehydroquinate synthase